MPRIWPLRSFPNFLLTVLGSSAIGFYGYGMYRESFFANPIVSEAVKVLGKN
jgi:hypothetical protein